VPHGDNRQPTHCTVLYDTHVTVAHCAPRIVRHGKHSSASLHLLHSCKEPALSRARHESVTATHYMQTILLFHFQQRVSLSDRSHHHHHHHTQAHIRTHRWAVKEGGFVSRKVQNTLVDLSSFRSPLRASFLSSGLQVEASDCLCYFFPLKSPVIRHSSSHLEKLVSQRLVRL